MPKGDVRNKQPDEKDASPWRGMVKLSLESVKVRQE